MLRALSTLRPMSSSYAQACPQRYMSILSRRRVRRVPRKPLRETAGQSSKQPHASDEDESFPAYDPLVHGGLTRAAIWQPPNPHILRAGVLGAPNSGKSTLINAIVGDKVSIVSPKAQTTQDRVLAVHTRGSTQIVFVDTPGLLRASGAPEFHQTMKQRELSSEALSVLDKTVADVLLLVVDASQGITPFVKHMCELIVNAERSSSTALVLNKVDLVTPKTLLLEMADEVSSFMNFENVFMTCALTGDNVAPIAESLFAQAAPGKWEYDRRVRLDMSPLRHVEEIVREKVFRAVHKEVPYSVVQRNIEWRELRDGTLAITQVLLVDRESHVRMIVGRGGVRLAALRRAARSDMEAIFGRKVKLTLQVDVSSQELLLRGVSADEDEDFSAFIDKD